MIQQPARQIHLDFHTSEHIPGVGSRFDQAQWQEALRLGHVNSINLFAKCHHGWSYYPTRAGHVHPTLQGDLLGQQIAACHEIGVRCPIYFTVGWSANDAEEHPEWLVRDREGRPVTTDPALAGTPDPDARRPSFSWKYLCPSGDYLALILAQTAEICQRYAVDGFWYDICGGPVCYCATCRAAIQAAGRDPDVEVDAKTHTHRKWRHMIEACNEIILRYHPQATVFYNGTTVMYEDGRHTAPASDYYKLNTHYELEDLPTTWGGYDKFSMRAKYFLRTDALIRQGKPIVAMSGKFHTSWGEFGGFKHPDAIRYEAAAMIAHGAACCMGDQLHPAGEMDGEHVRMGTYANIGAAYQYVAQIEAYGLPATPVSNLGLWRTGAEAHDQGVVNMLLETQTDYVVVDPDEDLSAYEAIILTGAACLTPEQAARLNAFAASSGGLLVLGESALDTDKTHFLLDVGATYLGPARYELDYLVVGDTLATNIVRSPFLNYSAAIRALPEAGTEVLAAIREPYFDRTYARYCSHQNTPYRLQDAAHPGALRAGNVVFLPHPLGAMYHAHGARVHRDLFINALRLIHTRPMVATQLPSAGRVTLMHQLHARRYVVHLLYAPPLQRGRCLVIEDLVPLYNVPVTVRVPETIARAILVPGGEALPLERAGGAVHTVVPVVHCHQAVVLEY
jgi:hypothetical protein